MHRQAQMKMKCFLLAHFAQASAQMHLSQRFSAQGAVKRGRVEAVVTRLGEGNLVKAPIY